MTSTGKEKMTQALASMAGVDISKDRLDVHVLPNRDERSFANDASALREFIRWLQPLSPQRIVYEATGAYHRLLERTLATDRWPLCRARLGPVMQPDIRALESQTLDALW